MTTNGLLLQDKVQQLKDAGLVGVNISLDTLADRFKAICGIAGVDKILTSITVATDAESVKINTVL